MPGTFETHRCELKPAGFSLRKHVGDSGWTLSKHAIDFDWDYEWLEPLTDERSSVRFCPWCGVELNQTVKGGQHDEGH